jgi:hypothetical protein
VAVVVVVRPDARGERAAPHGEAVRVERRDPREVQVDVVAPDPRVFGARRSDRIVPAQSDVHLLAPGAVDRDAVRRAEREVGQREREIMRGSDRDPVLCGTPGNGDRAARVLRRGSLASQDLPLHDDGTERDVAVAFSVVTMADPIPVSERGNRAQGARHAIGS